MVPDALHFTDQQFSNLLSTCDPATARLGEGFLDPELNQYFDKEMLDLLQDSRKAWM